MLDHKFDEGELGGVPRLLGGDHVEVVAHTDAVELLGEVGYALVGGDVLGIALRLAVGRGDGRKGRFHLLESHQNGLLVLAQRFVVGRAGDLLAAGEAAKREEGLDE